MRRSISPCFFVLTCILVSFGSGCAFTDQNAILKYTPVSDTTGGAGEVQVAKPTVSDMKLLKGKQVIGTVKNTLGMVTADVLSEYSVEEWFRSAVVAELGRAGYQAQTTETLPAACLRGVELAIIKAWVDQDPGFWTVGAVANVQFRLTLYSNGTRIKEILAEGTGQGSRSAIGHTGTKESAMTTALQQAMKQAMPEIVAAFSGAPR